MDKSSDFVLLIVDDNPKNLQLLGSILKENEYKVEFATNGTEALDWLEEQLFDLVLLDIMMPGMDGFETCRKIREHDKHSDMPVIFLTAKTSKESIIKGFESGAQDYISKPFDKNELLARVNTHLELKASKTKLREVNSWLEEKVAERTIQLEEANKQLEKLDEAKTEFLNLIGHEIRTPLNGIIGPMQLIRTESHNSELNLMLGLMEESVERLEKFAFQALLISNLRTGKYNFNAEKVDIRELAENLNTSISSILDKSSTELDIRIENPVFAIGDKNLIKVCIERLVENTLQYIESSGTLVIETLEEEGYIEIHLSDRRIEFSENFLDSMDKLFEPSGKYSDSNLGIEMVLVNLILNSHNASLTMKNLDKLGATLIVRIPQ